MLVIVFVKTAVEMALSAQKKENDDGGHMGSRETIGERSKTHGMTSTRLYGVLCSMKDRCLNSKVEHYDRYGGRGISVCQSWRDSFETFRDWAFQNGYDENATGKENSLDRIDPDGDYCPDNCRWVSKLEQARNRTDTVYIFWNGKKIPSSEFADVNSIKDRTFVFRRAKKGETGEKILHDWIMMHKTPDNYLKIKDAEEAYGVSSQTILSWIKSGKLKAEKCGNKFFIEKGQVVARRQDRDLMGRFLPGKRK